MTTKLSSYQKLKKRLFDSEMRLYELQKAVADDDYKTLIKTKVSFKFGEDRRRAFWFGRVPGKQSAIHAKGLLNKIINGDQKPNV